MNTNKENLTTGTVCGEAFHFPVRGRTKWQENKINLCILTSSSSVQFVSTDMVYLESEILELPWQCSY